MTNDTNLDPIDPSQPVSVPPLDRAPLELESIIEEEQPDPIVEKKDEPVIVEEPERKKQNIVQEFSTIMEENLATGEEIILPANYEKETRAALDYAPNINMLDNPGSRAWAHAVTKGLTQVVDQNVFVPTLEDPDAEFKQRVEHMGQSMMGLAPKFPEKTNEDIKGEGAVIRLISHMGLGTLYQTPLWNSGIHVTFKPPSESEIIELNRVMVSDKIKFGRYSYGLAFSNTTSYTIDRLMDFAIAHIYNISAKKEAITTENIRQHIVSQDIPSFLLGFICTMYPRGFRYRRACVSNPGKCDHVEEETLNVTKLQWTNGRALSDWQKTHMSSRAAKVKDLDSINRYKEELTRIQKSRIEINKGQPNELVFTIKSPSVQEYVNAGHRWIGDIVNTVDQALGADTSDNERNAIIIRHGQASALRQYSHWIDSLEFKGNTVTDQETIETILNTLSADDDIRTQIITSVVDYINKSTLSVIGIPVYNCPKCNAEQKGNITLPQHANIIPLDVIQVFFDLLSQRVERLMER